MEKLKTHSKMYDNGALWVACSECNRGGNGLATDKCSAGGFIKNWDKLGCFKGELIADIVVLSPVLRWKGTQDEAVFQWHQKNDAIILE